MISVIVPAHNEEKVIGECLASIRKAEASPVEIVVVLNRCTDRTEEIARSYNAKIVHEDAKNLSIIRNAGGKAASGETIVTIDADSRMSAKMLTEIERKLATGKFIGGGTIIWPERWSLGIILSGAVVFFFALLYGLRSAGLFWCRKKDFDAIGGFDETRITIEDLDFANRLAEHGKSFGMKYGTIHRAHIITSCRKFDRFGDWYFFWNPGVVRRLFKEDKKSADVFYYDFKH